MKRFYPMLILLSLCFSLSKNTYADDPAPCDLERCNANICNEGDFLTFFPGVCGTPGDSIIHVSNCRPSASYRVVRPLTNVLGSTTRLPGQCRSNTITIDGTLPPGSSRSKGLLDISDIPAGVCAFTFNSPPRPDAMGNPAPGNAPTKIILRNLEIVGNANQIALCLRTGNHELHNVTISNTNTALVIDSNNNKIWNSQIGNNNNGIMVRGMVTGNTLYDPALNPPALLGMTDTFPITYVSGNRNSGIDLTVNTGTAIVTDGVANLFRVHGAIQTPTISVTPLSMGGGFVNRWRITSTSTSVGKLLLFRRDGYSRTMGYFQNNGDAGRYLGSMNIEVGPAGSNCSLVMVGSTPGLQCSMEINDSEGLMYLAGENLTALLVNEDGFSEFTNNITLPLDLTSTPDAPFLGGSHQTDDPARNELGWLLVPGASSYELQRSNTTCALATESTFTDLRTGIAANISAFYDLFYSAGQTYCYRLRAVMPDGYSSRYTAYSDLVEISIPEVITSRCGNGVLELGESCDDGDVLDNGCNATCSANTMGYQCMNTSGGRSTCTRCATPDCSPVVDTPPAVPSGLRASGMTSSAATLTWTANSDATRSYELYRAQVTSASCTGASYSTTAVALIAHPSNSFNDTGLMPETYYCYKIRALDGMMRTSDFSSPISLRTLASGMMGTTPPSVPGNLSASFNREARRVSLSWMDTSSNEDGFLIYRAPVACSAASESDFITIATLASNTSSYEDTAIEENRTYCYRIFSRNAAGRSSSFSQVEFLVPNFSGGITPPGSGGGCSLNLNTPQQNTGLMMYFLAALFSLYLFKNRVEKLR